MLTQYFAGLLNKSNQLYGQAIISFLRSEEAASELKDDYMLGAIYHNISVCYNLTYNQIQALEYSELSLKHFRDFGDDSHIRNALRHLATMQINAEEYDKAIGLCNKLTDISTERNDTILMSTILSILGSAYIEMEQYNLAFDKLSQLKTMQNGLSCPKDIRNLGIASLKTGKLDSAITLSQHLEKLDTTDHRLKYQIYSSTGQFDMALKELKYVLNEKNNKFKAIISQNSQKQISGYYDRQHRQLKRDVKRATAQKNALITGGALFLLLIYFAFQYRVRLARRKMDETMNRAHELATQLSGHEKSLFEAYNLITKNNEELSHIKNTALAHENKFAEMQATLKSSFHEQFGLINDLCETYYLCKGASNERTKIYHRVLNIFDSLKTDGKLSNDMEQSANERFNNIMNSLRCDYPQLKQDDYKLFLFLIAGLSPRSISTLFNIKIEAVYNRKAKLKVKLVQQNAAKSGQYITFLN